MRRVIWNARIDALLDPEYRGNAKIECGGPAVKRICSKCSHSIRRHDRWHMVKSIKLWFWTVEKPQHYSCLYPDHGPEPKRVKSKKEIPFIEVIESDVIYHGTAKQSPAQELADLV